MATAGSRSNVIWRTPVSRRFLRHPQIAVAAVVREDKRRSAPSGLTDGVWASPVCRVKREPHSACCRWVVPCNREISICPDWVREGAPRPIRPAESTSGSRCTRDIAERELAGLGVHLRFSTISQVETRADTARCSRTMSCISSGLSRRAATKTRASCRRAPLHAACRLPQRQPPDACQKLAHLQCAGMQSPCRRGPIAASSTHRQGEVRRRVVLVSRRGPP